MEAFIGVAVTPDIWEALKDEGSKTLESDRLKELISTALGQQIEREKIKVGWAVLPVEGDTAVKVYLYISHPEDTLFNPKGLYRLQLEKLREFFRVSSMKYDYPEPRVQTPAGVFAEY